MGHIPHSAYVTACPLGRHCRGHLRIKRPQVLEAHLCGILRTCHGDLMVMGHVGEVGEARQGLQLHEGL